MNTEIQKIDLKNMDKSNWSSYRFDEIAFKRSERVDPNNTDLEIYVGLEHIDSESLHIKRFGTRDDVNGTKFRCRPGDIIFGRRRAYQRKAAIVDFEGFCSAHSLVLYANPEIIAPKLFPFFLHSDTFMHRAVDISVGSLSPTINWGTLKHQEFLLPPLDQQAELAELLWAGDDVTERSVKNTQRLFSLKKACMKKWLIKGLRNSKLKKSPLGMIPQDWEITTFEKVLFGMKSGLSRRIVKKDIGIPVIFSGNIKENQLDTSELKYWFLNDPKGANVSNYILKEGDVLLCFINSLSKIGKCCLFKDIGREAIYTTNLFRLQAGENLNNVFLYYLLCSDYIQRKIKQITMPAVNQASFTKSDFLRIKFSIPSTNEQIEIVKQLTNLDEGIEKTKLKSQSIKSLQKSIINQIF